MTADRPDDDRRPVPSIGLRPADACRALGVSRRTLCTWTCDRTLAIPHVRIGKCILYPERELRDWLAARIERPR
ncbi:MAG: helix-turn-helix domain-containing protein [Phycisphaerales bacterium]|nr:helix-turn-helix domain-containing protein [Phycisphaerales bacterium]